MNTTFLKLAIRNIRKNKINSIINILGFSLGLAACLFIFLFTKFETGFDNFYPNQDRLFRLVGEFSTPDQKSTEGFVYYPVAPAVANNIPGIKSFCRVTGIEPAKCYVNNQLSTLENLRFADDNFFSFFPFKLITGNPSTVLNSADKIVLTKETALRIFGTIDVVGQPVFYQHQHFIVSGIAAETPANTHLNFDAIASIKHIEQSDSYWKGWGGGITFLSYIELIPNVTPQQIAQQFPELLEQKINNQWRDRGISYELSLQKISDIHLSDRSITYDCNTNRSKKSIYIINTICLLILILAIVNYIILYTGQNLSKLKEIGILKLHGAGKYRIIIQTYTEVLIVSCIASLISFALLGGILPFLNSQLNTHIIIKENIIAAVGFVIPAILLLSVIVTFFSTFKMRKLKLNDILKGNSRIKVKGNNLLVSLQFTIVILLMISVLCISKQNRFLLNRELGFNKEDMLIIESDDEFLNDELDGFKQELMQLAEIQTVSLSSQTIGSGLTQNGYTIEGETKNTMLNVIYTDADFLNCYKLNLIEGENFSTNNAFNKDAILINREMVKQTGWKEPVGKTIMRNGKLHVIGVVDNFNFGSLENSMKPLLIMANPAWDDWGYSTINIRYQTNDIQGLIRKINKLWQNHFPETPFDIRFLDNILNQNYASYRAQQKVIGFFSFLTIFIAMIGLFGLTVFTTRNRIKEIGIRKVNGARVSEILSMLNREFIKWVVIAFVIATPIAWYVMHKWLENFAYKTALSWWIFALSGILAIGIALLTVSWQSWRAATKNPVEALRYE